MDQRTTVIGLLMFVVLAFGGLIYYDVKFGHKFEKLMGKVGQSNNWRWEDGWDGKGPSSSTPGPQGPSVPQGPSAPQPNGPQLIAGSYAEALQKSGETGKPVLAFFTADWCTWCKKMKNETMTDSRVQSVLKNYILVYVDSDHDRNAVRKFGVDGLPSYVITNSREDKLKVETGFKSPEIFSSWLNDSSLFNQPKGAPTQPRAEEKEPEKKEPPRRRQPQRGEPTQPQNRPPCGPGG
jgi:thiol-disulfide isomerase/thioredoxin